MLQVVCHKERLSAAFFPCEYLKLNKGEFSLLLFSYSSFFPKCLCTFWPLPVASAQLGIVTWGDKGWSVTAWGEKVTPLSTGSFSFSPLRVLLFTCWVVGFQLCNSQLDPWICAGVSANSPSLLLLQCYLYLFYSSARKVKTFLLLFCVCSCNIYLYGLRNLWQISFHIGVAFLSSYQILTRQLLEKQPDCGVWKKTNKTTWGLLLCFYNSFLYSLGQK